MTREHGVLKRVLLVYGEAIRRIEANEDLPPETGVAGGRVFFRRDPRPAVPLHPRAFDNWRAAQNLPVYRDQVIRVLRGTLALSALS